MPQRINKTKKQVRDNSLDYLSLLKFISAVIIAIFYHNWFLSQYSSHDIPVISYLHNTAFLFVEMFFLMSGMLFYKAYFNKLINKETSYGTVIRKRLVNTYVLATITSLYVFLMNFISFKINDGNLYRDGTLDGLTIFITIICGGGTTLFNAQHPNNGPAWYLTSLLFSYFVALLLTFIISKFKKKPIYFFLIPIGLGLGMYYSRLTLPFLWNIDLSRGLMFFFFGIFLMMFLDKFKNFETKIRLPIRIISSCIALSYIILLCFDNIRNLLHLSTIPMMGFVFFPLVIISLYNLKRLNAFVNYPIVKRTLSISFEVYLLNYPIHATLFLIGYQYFDFTIMGYWFILFDIVLHLIFAFIVNYLISKKLTNQINRLIDFIKLKIVGLKKD